MVSRNSSMFLMQKPQWWHHCFTRTDKGDSKHSVWICHVSMGLIWIHLDVQCWFIAPCFRCVDAEAYEVKREDVTNGIFISFLKRRVCEDEKVTVMLDRVAEGMWRTQLMWQMDVYLKQMVILHLRLCFYCVFVLGFFLLKMRRYMYLILISLIFISRSMLM